MFADEQHTYLSHITRCEMDVGVKIKELDTPLSLNISIHYLQFRP